MSAAVIATKKQAAAALVMEENAAWAAFVAGKASTKATAAVAESATAEK